MQDKYLPNVQKANIITWIIKMVTITELAGRVTTKKKSLTKQKKNVRVSNM